MDPPVRGSFLDGVGTVYAADTENGKPIRIRIQSGPTDVFSQAPVTYEAMTVISYDLGYDLGNKLPLDTGPQTGAVRSSRVG